MLAKRINQLERIVVSQNTQHVTVNQFGLCVASESSSSPQYLPSKTAQHFHADRSFVKCVMGPYGSGKSSMCAAEIVLQAINMPSLPTGVRKSRWALIRNTYGELENTTIKTWLDWFGNLGDVKTKVKPPYIYHTFNDANGPVELELIFLALDRPDHIKKLKSLELTGAYLNELAELPHAVLDHIQSRVGRYPSHKYQLEYWNGIIADTNPPDTDHWFYQLFEIKQPKNFKLFKQPPGLLKNIEGDYQPNPNADNVQHLPQNYYLRMTEGNTEDFIRVYALGKYGAVQAGKPIYPEYNDDWHGVDRIKPLPNLPLYLGWDYGLTPAVVICQVDSFGRLRVLRELCAQSLGVENFVKNVVRPLLDREFADYPIALSIGDPAGTQRAQTNELMCQEILDSYGIPTEPARTNAIEPRLESVRWHLNNNIDGHPAILIDRTKCPQLRKGFLNGYRFKRLQVSGEVYADKPDKNEYSHIHDALQYLCLYTRGANTEEVDNDFEPTWASEWG